MVHNSLCWHVVILTSVTFWHSDNSCSLSSKCVLIYVFLIIFVLFFSISNSGIFFSKDFYFSIFLQYIRYTLYLLWLIVFIFSNLCCLYEQEQLHKQQITCRIFKILKSRNAVHKAEQCVCFVTLAICCRLLYKFWFVFPNWATKTQP